MADLIEEINKLQPGMVAVLGIPYDGGATFLAGQAQAPVRIRESLYSDSTNLSAENGMDLSAHTGWKDIGDLAISSDKAAFGEIEKALGQLMERDCRAAVLGGDHSITYPILRACAGKYSQLSLLQLDAHADLYDEFAGKRFSHASPFARIMEQGLVKQLVQVGIRTQTPHLRAQAENFGVQVIEMREWDPAVEIELGEYVYLSLDMDVLDPAYAPGVSHHEPGGMTTREIIKLIQGLKGTLIGADIVEYNPDKDVVGITAMAAAKLLKEIIARMMAT